MELGLQIMIGVIAIGALFVAFMCGRCGKKTCPDGQPCCKIK